MKRGVFTILSFCLILVCSWMFTGCQWDPVGISEPWLTEEPEEPCNGDPSLCGKAYNEVVFPSTNNSYNYEFGVTQFNPANQPYPVRRQLMDGIRAVNLDLSELEGDVVVINRNETAIDLVGLETYAGIVGFETAQRPLREIAEFLEANPREVVTVFLDTELDGATVEAEFQSAGLEEYLHINRTGFGTTLEEMIELNQRLVVFSTNSDIAGDPVWLHDAWANCHDTGTDAGSADDLSCELNQGSNSNPLSILNHWVVPLLGGGSASEASEVNEFDFLFERATDCWEVNNARPNFIMVDYYGNGDLFEVCDSLNRLED